ncbi:C39 family peptidase [Leptospira sp. GIMC2001]|uniref:C39 family peptidase n=1 Tax=Leptospira sp. GIMC2001 TaxID=1513297 RepID=UPI00234A312B|nr:C39 family peptidase [Leptospira sp. GIMC2001]WCL48255.1 C39 family peptidase [Leptospira sp. GIMC2001]
MKYFAISALILHILLASSLSDIAAQTMETNQFLNCHKDNSKSRFIAIPLGEKKDQLKLINRDSQILYLSKANCEHIYPEITKDYKKLNLLYTKQSENKLCGPASIQMIFNYWGVNQFDQYDIMYSILRRFKNEGRYKNINIDKPNAFDLKLYPGTGTINMRQYLEEFSDVDNGRIKKLPSNESEHYQIKMAFLHAIQSYIDRNIPVIVHQNWSKTSKNGHYRIVNGFDRSQKIIYLMDARSGEITQSYDEFFELWNVEDEYLPYNFIAFNINGKQLKINSIP